jgi:hypothetical protein
MRAVYSYDAAATVLGLHVRAGGSGRPDPAPNTLRVTASAGGSGFESRALRLTPS